MNPLRAGRAARRLALSLALPWLALRAPALYKDAGWEKPKRHCHVDPDLPAYRRRSLRWQDNRALGACAAFTGDVLIVESEHDVVIPHPVIENYVAAFGKARSMTARLIEGADHGLSSEAAQRAYTTLLLNWLTEMVIGARTSALAPHVNARSAARHAEAAPPPGAE